MKTRILVVSLLAIFIASSMGFAQTHFEVESQNLISSQDGDFNISPTVDTYMTHAFNDSKWGTFAWFLVCENWAEGYAGLTFAPLSWCQLGLGFGLEKADDPWRVGGSVWFGHERYSLLILLEEGGGAFWHRIVANYKLSRVFGIGYMSEEFVGVGPRVEVNIPKTPVQVWSSLLRKDGKNNIYLTFKLTF